MLLELNSYDCHSKHIYTENLCVQPWSQVYSSMVQLFNLQNNTWNQRQSILILFLHRSLYFFWPFFHPFPANVFQMSSGPCFFLSINRNLPTSTKRKRNFQKKTLTLQNNTEKIAPSGEMSSTVLYVYAWLMNIHILGQPTLLKNQWMKFRWDLAWCQSSAVHVDSMCMWKFTVWACTKHGVSQYAMSGFWNLLLPLEKIPPDETFFLLLGRNVNNESLYP